MLILDRVHSVNIVQELLVSVPEMRSCHDHRHSSVAISNSLRLLNVIDIDEQTFASGFTLAFHQNKSRSSPKDSTCLGFRLPLHSSCIPDNSRNYPDFSCQTPRMVVGTDRLQCLVPLNKTNIMAFFEKFRLITSTSWSKSSQMDRQSSETYNHRRISLSTNGGNWVPSFP